MRRCQRGRREAHAALAGRRRVRTHARDARGVTRVCGVVWKKVSFLVCCVSLYIEMHYDYHVCVFCILFLIAICNIPVHVSQDRPYNRFAMPGHNSYNKWVTKILSTLLYV